jgi:hypothetical protein
LTVANTIDRVKQNIRERLEELEGERDQLMRALEALSGTPPAVGRRGRPPGSGAKRGGSTNAGKRAAGRRAPRGQRREQVVAALLGGEKGPSAIAREIGDVNPTQISGLLRQLASEGVVTRTAGGKWRLTATAEHNWAPAEASDRASEAPVPGAPAPAASPGAE